MVPATHADGLRVGLPVLIASDSRRGVIAQYSQPFFNPEPRTVTVNVDGVVSDVPLANVLIWQRAYYGPERTVGDETRKVDANIRRYVNVADPNGERPHRTPLPDKHESRQAIDVGIAKFRFKQITEIDKESFRHEAAGDPRRFSP